MPELEDALHAALDEITPDLPTLLADLPSAAESAETLDDQATAQFLRAFVALLHEGIDGGREQRDLVMSTAVPALVAAGQTETQLVQSHVTFFMALQGRMLAAVAPEHRHAAALWLADYAGTYTCEVLETAQAAR